MVHWKCPVKVQCTNGGFMYLMGLWGLIILQEKWDLEKGIYGFTVMDFLINVMRGWGVECLEKNGLEKEE